MISSYLGTRQFCEFLSTGKIIAVSVFASSLVFIHKHGYLPDFYMYVFFAALFLDFVLPAKRYIVEKEVVIADGAHCPRCSRGTQKQQTMTEKFEYRGIHLDIPNYTYTECDNCKEKFITLEVLEKTEELVEDFCKSVDKKYKEKEIDKEEEK